MISPHTPPGTRVVCIDAKVHLRFANAHIPKRPYSADPLIEGHTYTVDQVILTRRLKSGYAVVLVERGWNGFALERFRLAELPRCLTQILEGAPIDSELERHDA